MSIKIVLPEGDYPKPGYGTRVYNDDGSEINDVLSVDISIGADGLIEANIRIVVSGIENLEYVEETDGN